MPLRAERPDPVAPPEQDDAPDEDQRAEEPEEPEELPELEEWIEPSPDAPPARSQPALRPPATRKPPAAAERDRSARRQLVYAFVILAIGLGWAGFVLFGPRSDVLAGRSSLATRSASGDIAPSAANPDAAVTDPDPAGGAPIDLPAAPASAPAPMRVIDARDLLKTFTLQGLRVEDLLVILGPPSAGVPPEAVRYEFAIPGEARLLVWSDASREVFAAAVLDR
jgi:hypothetical protein